MKTNKNILKMKLIIFLLTISTALFAQDSTQTAPVNKEQIKSTFENGVLINNQTVESLRQNSLEIMIQHRFGVIFNNDDLYGIFAPSNIRLGVGYGITKNFSAGFGVIKNKRLYELEGKYVVLRQTTHKMPVTVSAYGNIARSALPEADFLNQESKYYKTNRLEYLGELMIARKINRHLSVQLAGSYTHINLVDTLMRHDIIGASFAGRYKFSPQSSVMLEFDYPITLHQVSADLPSTFQQKPNLGIGYECSTGSHQFQIFVCTSEAIAYSQIMAYNQNDFTKRQVLIGFNITREWGF